MDDIAFEAGAVILALALTVIAVKYLGIVGTMTICTCFMGAMFLRRTK